MPTNRDLLNKGIKYLLVSLPMMFFGPSVIYNAFMNKKNVWHYLVLAVGILICIAAVYYAFKGIKTITDSIFEYDEKKRE
jgi:polyferredoxin